MNECCDKTIAPFYFRCQNSQLYLQSGLLLWPCSYLPALWSILSNPCSTLGSGSPFFGVKLIVLLICVILTSDYYISNCYLLTTSSTMKMWMVAHCIDSVLVSCPESLQYNKWLSCSRSACYLFVYELLTTQVVFPYLIII